MTQKSPRPALHPQSGVSYDIHRKGRAARGWGAGRSLQSKAAGVRPPAGPSLTLSGPSEVQRAVKRLEAGWQEEDGDISRELGLRPWEVAVQIRTEQPTH